MKRLLLDFSPRHTKPAAAESRFDFESLRSLGPWTALRRLRSERFDECLIRVAELRRPRRWMAMLVVGLLARAKRRRVLDDRGESFELSWRRLLHEESLFSLRRLHRTAEVLAAVAPEVWGRLPRRPPRARCPRRPRRVLILRPDLGPALRSGGSLAHLRGVASGLVAHGYEVTLISAVSVPAWPEKLGSVLRVPPRARYDLSVELPHLAYNLDLLADPRVREAVEDADWIYARHALGCYAPAVLARRHEKPLVLEYNGPEVWIARHWGAARSHMRWFRRIESRVCRAAHLVAAVSREAAATLAPLGVEPRRVKMLPNAVDPSRFDVATLRRRRDELRERLGIAPRHAAAIFLGTFGPWHGAEMLAGAWNRCAPSVQDRLHLVFIGQGPRLPEVRREAATAWQAGRAHFLGDVPFDEVPAWLAAGDIGAVPTLPNPDGSPFFGSPTKLFESMAAGLAVVASRLGDVDRVIRDGVSGLLVTPADPGALSRALCALVEDPQRRRALGEAAREEVLSRHTWAHRVAELQDSLTQEAAPLTARTQSMVA